MNAGLIGSIIYNYYYKDEENEMIDHKFTDEKVEKALRCCYEGDCYPCRYRIGGVDCRDRMQKDALDLINRQKAEIERLNKEVDRLSQCVLYHDGIVSDLEKDVFNAKAEAIKEFAERAKKKMNDLSRMEYNGTPYFLVSKSFIDNLVKEMTEETKL